MTNRGISRIAEKMLTCALLSENYTYVPWVHTPILNAIGLDQFYIVKLMADGLLEDGRFAGQYRITLKGSLVLDHIYTVDFCHPTYEYA